MGVDNCAATYLAAYAVGQCHTLLQLCLTAEKPAHSNYVKLSDNHSHAFAASVQSEHLTKVHSMSKCKIHN